MTILVLPTLTFLVLISIIGSNVSYIPIYMIINFFTLVVCQCLHLSFTFCVVLSEAREILMNVSFEKFPELDLYSEFTVQNNIFKNINFRLARSEVLQTLVVQTQTETTET